MLPISQTEIILLFVLVFALYYFLTRLDGIKNSQHITLGIIIGISIGLHPNSFILFLPFSLIYIFHIFFMKKLKLSGLFLYIGTVTCFAAGFVALSLYLDPDFLQNYGNYGREFGVLSPIDSKISEIIVFYQKLYYQVSGTYYTPDIQLQFYLFAISFFVTLYKLYKVRDPLLNPKITAIVLSILAINAGIIIIGRFNQTSVVFLFPLFYILMIYLLESLKQSWKWLTVTFLALALSASTLLNTLPYLAHSYDDYLQQIAKVVQKNDTVLANLNTEFYFENGKLYDFRNLLASRKKTLLLNNISIKTG
jgi:hypothetical protein